MAMGIFLNSLQYGTIYNEVPGPYIDLPLWKQQFATVSRLLLAFPCLWLMLGSDPANNDVFTGCINIHQEKLIIGIRREFIRGPPSVVSRQVRERRKRCLNALLGNVPRRFTSSYTRKASNPPSEFEVAPEQARRSGFFPVSARRGWLSHGLDNKDQEFDIAFHASCSCGPGGRQPDLQ